VETVRSRFVGTAAGLLPCFVSQGTGDPAVVDDGGRVAAF
jgi:hypothetical protein